MTNVFLTDTNSLRHARLDGVSDALQVILYEHHELHAGSFYWADHATTGGTALTLAFKTPAGTKFAHLEVLHTNESKCHIEIFKGATWTTNTGTVYAPVNQRQSSSNTSMLLEDKTATPAYTAGGILRDPTGVSGGTIAKRWYSFANKQSGGDGGSRHEIMLDQDETYAIVMTSDDGSKGMQLVLYWYEHTDKV